MLALSDLRPEHRLAVHKVIAEHATDGHPGKPDDPHNVIGGCWPDEDPAAYLAAANEMWSRGAEGEAAASVLALVAGRIIQARQAIARWCSLSIRTMEEHPGDERYLGTLRGCIADVYVAYRKNIRTDGEYCGVVDHHPCS